MANTFGYTHSQEIKPSREFSDETVEEIKERNSATWYGYIETKR